MRLKCLVVLASLVPGLCLAQALSIEEIQKQIDAEMTRTNPYGDLLNEPDPKRALAAMKVMMASGDPELVRIAADYGLYSANAAVRAEAFKAFLATKPRVDVYFSEDGSRGNFSAAMGDKFRSEPNSKGIVATTLVIGDYDAKNDCYEVGSSSCALQIRPEAIRINLSGRWNEVTLTDEASLVGNVNLGQASNVPMRMQLR
ncbi:MAG: hypothetical protein ACK4HF_04550 [Paracoccaceae bacterium]